MNKTLLILISLLVFSSTFAFNSLNGEIRNTGNGNYYVRVLDDGGHEYIGRAMDNVNGNLDVIVSDYNGYTYTGYATPLGGNAYDLNMMNMTTDENVGGFAEDEETFYFNSYTPERY